MKPKDVAGKLGREAMFIKIFIAVVFLGLSFGIFSPHKASAVQATGAEEMVLSQGEEEPISDGSSIMEEEEEEPLTDWFWGEVVSVGPQKGELKIKHVDYDTFEYVESALQVDEKTKFQNADALSEFREGDEVNVDYIVKDGSSVARILSLEKKGHSEETPAAQPATEGKGQEPRESKEPEEAKMPKDTVAVKVDKALVTEEEMPQETEEPAAEQGGALEGRVLPNTIDVTTLGTKKEGGIEPQVYEEPSGEPQGNIMTEPKIKHVSDSSESFQEEPGVAVPAGGAKEDSAEGGVAEE